jgi:methylthioribose-1-phosphate isomerase
MRTVEWNEGRVKMIDQRELPWKLVYQEYEDYVEVAGAITDMVIRGAPAIGGAAAFGMALAAGQAPQDDRDAFLAYMQKAAEHMKKARPTAVNLAWAVNRQMKLAGDPKLETPAAIKAALLEEAQRIADQDVDINRRMGAFGATLVTEGDTILHHCNTGALATVDFGTALGVIRAAHEQGKKIHTLLDETRPRLQGARLSAWELKQIGASFEIIADNAAGYFMYSGQVDIVFVGADRVAANGDTANKIGTYKLAVIAKENGVPFYVVAPTSTVDLSLASGDLIPIEERSPDEVRAPFGHAIVPDNYPARNPAFDVTPHRYVTGIVTENGIVYPPFVRNLKKAVLSKE